MESKRTRPPQPVEGAKADAIPNVAPTRPPGEALLIRGRGKRYTYQNRRGGAGEQLLPGLTSLTQERAKFIYIKGRKIWTSYKRGGCAGLGLLVSFICECATRVSRMRPEKASGRPRKPLAGLGLIFSFFWTKRIFICGPKWSGPLKRKAKGREKEGTKGQAKREGRRRPRERPCVRARSRPNWLAVLVFLFSPFAFLFFFGAFAKFLLQNSMCVNRPPLMVIGRLLPLMLAFVQESWDRNSWVSPAWSAATAHNMRASSWPSAILAVGGQAPSPSRSLGFQDSGHQRQCIAQEQTMLLTVKQGLDHSRHDWKAQALPFCNERLRQRWCASTVTAL